MLEVSLKKPEVRVYERPGLCHRQHHPGERLQFRQGMRQTGTYLQQLLIYKQVLRVLSERGTLTARRKKAACNVLWPLAHWIARAYPDEAAQVADWVYRLDPDFEPPNEGAMGWCYRNLGFRQTERILRARRMLLSPFRTLPAAQHDLPT
jgi:hypothetical protein